MEEVSEENNALKIEREGIAKDIDQMIQWKIFCKFMKLEKV